MRLPKVILALPLALVVGWTAWSADSTPAGIWRDPSGRLEVQIYLCGAALCGKLVWFRWPDDAAYRPIVDLMNPDPALRERPLLGLEVFDHLKPDGTGGWGGGRVYNPEDGINYLASMSIAADGTLQVRAFLLLPIFGETSVWTRIR